MYSISYLLPGCVMDSYNLGIWITVDFPLSKSSWWRGMCMYMT